MPHCPACPLDDPDAPCARELTPRYCVLAARERAAWDDLDPRQRHWLAAIREKSAGLATRPRPAPWYPPAARPDGRIRVGAVSPCCGMGGAERCISDYLDHCDGSRLRWEGIAIRHGPDPRLGPNLRADWEAHCPVAVGPGAIRALAARVDVLLTWGLLDVNWGIKPKELAALLPPGLPVISVSHGSTQLAEWPAKPFEATRVAVSRPALRGFPPDLRGSARVILNGVAPGRVATTRAPAETRALLGVPEGAKVVGWLGRISPEKGYLRFIEGVGALPAGWVGVVVGTGFPGDEASARDRAARVAPGRVIFAGHRDDVGDCLAAFDCMLMTSDTEGASLAAAEAWLAGTPLISTPVGLLEDHPGLARTLPPRPGGDRVAAAILADAADPVGTAGRVEMARRFAESELSMARYGGAWTDLLCEVAGPAPGPDLADCGDDVCIASRHGCDRQAHKFDRIVHAWRSDYPKDACRLKDRAGPDDLVVHWREHNPVETLDEMRPTLAEVVAFAKVPGRILVHCVGGVTRGPSLALAAKIARGCSPDKAEADIRAAMMRDRGSGTYWHEAIKDEIKRRLAPVASPATPPATPPAPLPPSMKAIARPASSPAPRAPLPAMPAVIPPEVVAKIAMCPARGQELAVSHPAYQGRCCGTAGTTLFGCSLGKGKVPRAVGVRECAECVGQSG